MIINYNGKKILKTFLSYIYGAGVALRNRAYDKNIFDVHDVGVPVISVGNITVGGTGKTPAIEMLLGFFLATRLKISVVTRGYRRRTKGLFTVSDGMGHISDADEGGDEPVQIARKFPHTVVIADEKRIRGCRYAIEKFKSDVIILDDGFQHRACKRDFDIVVIDSTQPVSEQRVLPAGKLREPMKNLKRAGVILLTKCEPGDGSGYVTHQIRTHATAPIFKTMYVPHVLRSFQTSAAVDPQLMKGKSVFAFCGIGSPASFDRTVAALGATIAGSLAFKDHHPFNASDISDILDLYKKSNADFLLTTEKDTMRLAKHSAQLFDVPLYYPEMKVVFLDNKKQFFQLIAQCIPRTSAYIS